MSLSPKARQAERSGSESEKESGEAALRSINSVIRKLEEELERDRNKRDSLEGKVSKWKGMIEKAQEESELSLEFEVKKEN